MTNLSLVPLSPSFGVEVRGIDLGKPLSAEIRAELRALFFKHHLLLFRKQRFESDQQIAFMSLISNVIVEPELRLRDAMKVPFEQRFTYLSNTEKATQGPAKEELCYHADMAWTPQGPMQAISLYSVELEQPSRTGFANMINAVKLMPSALRERIRFLVVDNTSPFTSTYRTDTRARLSERPADAPNWMYPHAEHAIVSRHPVTGEEFLYVSQMHTSHVVGWTDAESDRLFSELEHYAYSSENTYSHEWDLHDFVVWDNIGLQHRRDAISGTGNRTMRRAMANPYELGEMYAAAEAPEWKPALTYGEGGTAIFKNGTWQFN